MTVTLSSTVAVLDLRLPVNVWLSVNCAVKSVMLLVMLFKSAALSALLIVTTRAWLSSLPSWFTVLPFKTEYAAVIVFVSATVTTAVPRSPMNVPSPSKAAVTVFVEIVLRSASSVE